MVISIVSLLVAAYTFATSPAPLGNLVERVQLACGETATIEHMPTKFEPGQTGLRVNCHGEQIDVLQLTDAKTIVIVGDVGEAFERLRVECAVGDVYFSQGGGVSICRDSVLSWHRDTAAGKIVISAVKVR